MTTAPRDPPAAPDPDDRYRPYIDESGDHTWGETSDPAQRYLCLLGCFFHGSAYRRFHQAVEAFKQCVLPHSPDEPIILHRADIINGRGPFRRLRDPLIRQAFDEGLLALCETGRYIVVAVVIDKAELAARYPTPAHPYHLALGFLLQRYCGYLNHLSRVGDVMAESRGGAEDRLLKDSYERHYNRGAWWTKPEFFQRALTTKQLKLKRKWCNITGLQLADLLAHPVKQMVLREQGRIRDDAVGPFARRLLRVVVPKLNHHLYTGRIDGYGTVFFPK